MLNILDSEFFFNIILMSSNWICWNCIYLKSQEWKLKDVKFDFRRIVGVSCPEKGLFWGRGSDLHVPGGVWWEQPGARGEWVLHSAHLTWSVLRWGSLGPWRAGALAEPAPACFEFCLCLLSPKIYPSQFSWVHCKKVLELRLKNVS